MTHERLAKRLQDELIERRVMLDRPAELWGPWELWTGNIIRPHRGGTKLPSITFMSADRRTIWNYGASQIDGLAASLVCQHGTAPMNLWDHLDEVS